MMFADIRCTFDCKSLIIVSDWFYYECTMCLMYSFRADVWCFVIITNGPSNLTWRCIATARGQFSRIHQVVPVCIPFNTCLGLPKSTSQMASRFSRQIVSVLYDGPPPFSRNCPFCMEGSGLQSNTKFLRPPESTTETIPQLVSRFAGSQLWQTER